MHRFRILVLILFCFAVGPIIAEPDDGGLHIQGDKSTGWQWRTTDSKGFMWDINSNGTVSDGRNNAYDGGCALKIKGADFHHSTSGKLSEDAGEVEIGPWTHDNVKVWRRIRVNRKRAWCRWVDILVNTTDKPRKVTIQYYFNLGYGIGQARGSRGRAHLGKDDWALITTPSSSNSPTLVHVFRSPRSKVRPRVRYRVNSDDLHYEFDLELPPDKPVALCVIEAQRNNRAEAEALIEAFDAYDVTRDMPRALQTILANFSGSVLELGSLTVPRDEEHDLAVMRNGDEMLGTLLNEALTLETFFGPVELPRRRTLALAVPSSEENRIMVSLTDGQILAGTPTGPPLRMRLASGGEVTLRTDRLVSVGWGISAEKPHEVETSGPMAVLRSGQQLLFKPDAVAGEFQTQHGKVRLDLSDLAGIYFDTPEGGLQRALFRNGSVLSGLLEADSLKLQLDLGEPFDFPVHWLDRLVLTNESLPPQPLPTVKLSNGDVLLGRILNDQLAFETASGVVTVKPAQLATLEADEGLGVRVRCKLHNGTTLTGRMRTEMLRLDLQPGPELSVYPGLIAAMRVPKTTVEAAQE
jgi:hypothetical protein